MNIFKQHRQALAEATPVADEVDTNPAQPAHEIGIDEQLNQDLQRIKATERTERDGLKTKLIAKYQEAFDEFCKRDNWSGSLFIFWNILWRFDISDFTSAMALAKTAIERGLTSPFKSTFATTVADTVFKWAKQQVNDEADPNPHLAEFIRWLDGGLDVNPIIKAKLFKLHGDVITNTDPQQALDKFLQAQNLDDSIGVKGRVEKLQEQLKAGPK